jgi:hypothetical protein
MAEIEMFEVESRSIKKIGYDEEESELYIRFTTETLYVYSNVPGELYEGLLDAKSVGKYFAENIKGLYDFRKE